jgi:hypothetical protein
MGGLLGGPVVGGLVGLTGVKILCTRPPSRPSTMVDTIQLNAVIPPSE